jgi:hypothetical protein
MATLDGALVEMISEYQKKEERNTIFGATLLCITLLLFFSVAH